MPSNRQRILSGMRPTGRLHLGHYHGVLRNWTRLQREHACFFFVADWHALTTHYSDSGVVSDNVWQMVVDWLAAGVDPERATLFIQSQVPEHAELHVLLSMVTPLGWLERVPSFKDQQAKLKDRDLATYGFLGYPLLQSADILIYRATGVPVGEDQVAHVELTREIARRFNHFYGREPGFDEQVAGALAKAGKKAARRLRNLQRDYGEQGSREALDEGRELLAAQQNLSGPDRERLAGWLEGSGRTILPEPQAMLTPAARMPGLDGQKMSKSYHNTISLRDDPAAVAQKLKTMPTDPARVRRSDPGDPEKCPVWQFHQVYSDQDTLDWVQEGCRSAGIGCLQCKQPVVDAVVRELEPVQRRARELEADPAGVRGIMAEGCERARAVAAETMTEVREVMGLGYA
jgi:tryptophanyl-tRNA synthetase